MDALLQYGEVDLLVKNDFGNQAWLLATNKTVSEQIRQAALKSNCHICGDEFNTRTFRNVCKYCKEVSCGKSSCSRLKLPAEGSFACTRVCAKCVETDRIEAERIRAEEEERERIAKLNASYTFSVKIHDALNSVPAEENLTDLLASRSTGGGPVADFVIPASVRGHLPPRPPGLWVSIKVYVASTFADCHSERMYLDQIVFPALRHFARLRRIHVTTCDLRCDAIEDMVLSDRFLEVALEAIDDCQPFMLCLMGERYGWVPDSYDIPDLPKFALINEVEQGSRSTTEMEIKYGYLDRPGSALPFFYLRDAKFMAAPKFKSQEDQYRAAFEAEDDNSRLKLKSLKDEIQSTVPAQQIYVDYPAEFDKVDKGVPLLLGLEDFGRRVFSDMWTALDVAYPKRETGEKFLALRLVHNAFAENRIRAFRGRAKHLGALHLYAQDAPARPAGLLSSNPADPLAAGDAPGEENRPLPSAMLVLGEHGVGKSALLAQFAQEYRDKHPGSFVFTHFVGCGPESDEARALILRVSQELTAHFSLSTTSSLLEKLDGATLRRTFRYLLTEASNKGPVVLVLDNVGALKVTDGPPLTPGGEFTAGFQESAFDWLPEPLPARVRVIISSHTAGEAAAYLSAKYFSLQVMLGALEENDAKEIVKAVCQRYHKDVDREQLGLLMRKQDSNKPLYLATVGEELRKTRSAEEMTRAVKELPGALDGDKGMLGKLLDTLEAAHSRKVIEALFSAIYLSAPVGGILEADLLGYGGYVTGLGEGRSIPFAVWADILYVFREHLRPCVASTGYAFRHAVLGNLVKQRYLAGDVEQEHRRLAGYLRRILDPRGERQWTSLHDAAIVALPYHLDRAGLHADLQVDMCDLRYLERRCACQGVTAVATWFRQTLALPVFAEDVYVKLFVKLVQDWTTSKTQNLFSPQLRQLMDALSPMIDEFSREAPLSLALVREALRELPDEEIKELASQKKVSSLAHIMEVVLLAKANKGTGWKSAKSALLSPTFIQELVDLRADDIRDKAALKGRKILDHNQFSRWDIKLKSPAAAVMLGWAQAILHHNQRFVLHDERERLNEYFSPAVVNAEERASLLSDLDRASNALRLVSKSDLTELRSMADPPAVVKKIMSAVLTFLDKLNSGGEGAAQGYYAPPPPPAAAPPPLPGGIPAPVESFPWAEARARLGDPNFVSMLTSYDRDGVLRSTLLKVEHLVDGDTEIDPLRLNASQKTVSLLAAWVLALKNYVRFMLGAERKDDKKKKKKKGGKADTAGKTVVPSARRAGAVGKGPADSSGAEDSSIPSASDSSASPVKEKAAPSKKPAPAKK